MCSVLMSIKPEYVEKILLGIKEYEFRKKVCKRKIDKIYIYSTVPIQKVVGEATVEMVLIESPEKMWKITHMKAGVEKTFFDIYYENYDLAVAYKLSNVKKYNTPKTLGDLGIKVAPQSYQYIEG